MSALTNIIGYVEGADKKLDLYPMVVDKLMKVTTYTYGGLGRPVHKFYRVKKDAYSSSYSLVFLDEFGEEVNSCDVTEEAGLEMLNSSEHYCSEQFFETQVAINKAKKLIGVI